eukprot:2051667-Amphidinium_carterae.1
MESFMKSVYEVYGLQKPNSVSAPGVKSPALPMSGDEPLHFSDHKRFRTAVGKLQWMAAVRPDIQFAVKELSRKLSSHTSKDESAAKHLISYLRGTQNLVFRIVPSAWRLSSQQEVNNWCHLSVVGKSTEGIKLHVHTDSASGKAMVSKPGMSKKSKHIELKYLHLQGLVESVVITVHKIGTQNNASDILTKFMPQSTLSKHFGEVGLAETGIDEVSIQHLKETLKINAISSSTAEMD